MGGEWQRWFIFGRTDWHVVEPVNNGKTDEASHFSRQATANIGPASRFITAGRIDCWRLFGSAFSNFDRNLAGRV